MVSICRVLRSSTPALQTAGTDRGQHTRRDRGLGSLRFLVDIHFRLSDKILFDVHVYSHLH